VGGTKRKRKARKSHIFAKERHGHYVEPLWTSARLLEVDDFGPPGSLIYDPSCGWGHILRSAIDAGYRAAGSDIVDRLHRRELGLENLLRFFTGDFLYNRFPSRSRVTSVICNPPFDHVQEFCERGLDVAEYKVAMMCLLRRLPAARWLRSMPLETIYLITPRPSMPPGSWIAAGNKPGGGTQDFVWLVFNKLRSPRSPPVTRWLTRDAHVRGNLSGQHSRGAVHA
jgi:hypothetical protein